MVDLVLSMAEFAAQGYPDVGYRVRGVIGEKTQSAWVVRREGRYRVLTMGDEPGILALEAWRHANGGDLAVAVQWLDWLREELATEQADPEDPVDGPVFLKLWRPAGKPDATAVRVAAASQLRGPRAAQGLQALEAWRQALSDPRARFQVDRALLALAMRADRPAETVEVAKRLLAVAPDSPSAWVAGVMGLRRLGRMAEARALAEARLARKPDDPMALRELAELAAAGGQYDEAERFYAKVAGLGRSNPGDLNNRAWNAVFRAPSTTPRSSGRARPRSAPARPRSTRSRRCTRRRVARPRRCRCSRRASRLPSPTSRSRRTGTSSAASPSSAGCPTRPVRATRGRSPTRRRGSTRLRCWRSAASPGSEALRARPSRTPRRRRLRRARATPAGTELGSPWCPPGGFPRRADPRALTDLRRVL
jgi:hypothetical protein